MRARLPLRLISQVSARTCNLSRIIKDRTLSRGHRGVHTHIQTIGFASLVFQFRGIIIARRAVVRVSPYSYKFDRSPEITAPEHFGYRQEMEK